MRWIKTCQQWSYSTCPAEQQGTTGFLLDGRCVWVNSHHLFQIGVKFWCFGEHRLRLKLGGFHKCTAFSECAHPHPETLARGRQFVTLKIRKIDSGEEN